MMMKVTLEKVGAGKWWRALRGGRFRTISDVLFQAQNGFQTRSFFLFNPIYCALTCHNFVIFWQDITGFWSISPLCGRESEMIIL